MRKTRTARNYPKSFIISNFSMLEIILTLVVVIIGAIGIVTLYPVGLKSQQETIGISFASDAAEHFLRLSSVNIKKHWDWVNAYPNMRPGSNEPRQGNWREEPLVSYSNIRIRPTRDFNPNSDTNTGFFLLEQLSANKVVFNGVMRTWKSVANLDGNAKNAVLNVELSFPADVPYDSPNRKKETFSLEVYKPPQISLAATAYNDCAITKTHKGGYSTTLSSVVYDVNSSGYAIVLVGGHNGCSGVECPELSHYSIESNSGSYSNVSFNGVSGNLVWGPDLDPDPFAGFRISGISGIGDGMAGKFMVTYTIDSLQDQQITIYANGNSQIVTFISSELESVMECSGSDVSNGPECPDIETEIIHDGGNFEIKFYCSDVDLRTQGSLAVDELEFRSKNGTVAKLTASVHSDWSNLSIPAEAIPLAEMRAKQGGVWSGWILSDADCGSENINPPVFPNPTFTRPDRKLNVYFCYGLGSINEPSDDDGDELTYTLSGGPSWLKWNKENRQVAGTPNKVGTYTWTITVDDGCHTIDSELTITVVP